MFARISRSFTHVGRWSIEHWPVFVLGAVSTLLFLTNYVPGTYLVGWDNTMPELNLWLNLKRFIFGVWQEYRGLGTLDGMAHTANVIYWFYSAFLSLFLPTSVIRYIIQVICHLLGGVGVYFLSLHLLNRVRPSAPALAKQSSALLGALLVMLNFMTVQMFYIPLELFSLHFVALPWVTLMLLRYLENPSAVRLLGFTLICFFTASQSHVPTLFIVTAIVVGMLLLGDLVKNRSWAGLRKVLIAGTVFTCINGWWALPYAYSAVHKPAEIGLSKINRFSTNDIFLRNQAFGDLLSVLRFGSFNVDYLDWDSRTLQFRPLLVGWQQHYSSSAIAIVSSILSLLGLAGIIYVLKLGKRHRHQGTFTIGVIGLFSFTMLATDTLGIGIISWFFRSFVPLFHEIFRFTFTKFSLLYVMSLSVGFSFFTVWLTQSLIKNRRYAVFSGLIGLFIGVLLFTSVPIFQGYFFYPELRQHIPTDYFSVQRFFEQQPAHTRIAILPLNGFYGWTTNNWGHRGSGYLWQMLPQPSLDRAFDAWSKDNETFYHQLNAAVLAGSPDRVKDVFVKYQVQWLLLDRTIFQPGESTNATRIDALLSLLERSGVTHVEQFGKIDIFKVADLYLDPYLSDVTLIDDRYASDYTLTDQAYSDHGNYISFPSGIEYPFSFIQREYFADTRQLSQQHTTLRLPLDLKDNTQLNADLFSQHEQTVMTDVYTQQFDDVLLLRFIPQLPTIEGESLNAETLEVFLPLPSTLLESYLISIDDHIFTLNASSDETFLNRVILPTRSPVAVQLFSQDNLQEIDMFEHYMRVPAAQCWRDESRAWSVEKNEDKTLQLSSTNATACVSLDVPSTSQSNEEEDSLSNEKLLVVETASTSSTGNTPAHCVREKGEFACLNRNLKVWIEHGNDLLTSYAYLEPNQTYSLDILNTFREHERREDITYSRIILKEHHLVAAENVTIQAQVDATALDQQRMFAKLEAGKKHLIVPTISLPILPELHAGVHPYAYQFVRTPYLNCDTQRRGSIGRTVQQNLVTYTAVNKGSSCELFSLIGLETAQSYLFHITGHTSRGIGLKGSIFNSSSGAVEIDFNSGTGDFAFWYPLITSLDSRTASNTLRAKFTVQSYGREKNTVSLRDASLFPLPITWLSKIELTSSNSTQIDSQGQLNLKKKIGTFFYHLNASIESESILTLPQAYDPGWVLFNVKDGAISALHFTQNGWANAWKLDPGEYQLFIIFVPQVLSFFGWILTGGTLFVVAGYTLVVRRRKYTQRHVKRAAPTH